MSIVHFSEFQTVSELEGGIQLHVKTANCLGGYIKKEPAFFAIKKDISRCSVGHEQKQISSIERFIIQITGYVSEVMSKWRD